MIYIIHGEDDFLSYERLRKNKENFVKKHGDLGISFYDENDADIKKILDDIESLPFLTQKKLIVLENLIDKWNKDDKKKFIELSEKFPESSVVIFFERKKVNTRDAIIKSVPSQNILLTPKLYGYEINNWIEKKLKEKGYTIDKTSASKLASLVGGESRTLDKELKKLMALKHKEKKINQEDVELLVKAQLDTNIFNLTDALAGKDLKTSQKIVKNIHESGESLQSIIGMIAFQFRNIIFLKIAEKENIQKDILLKKTGIHPFVHQKTSAQLKNFTYEDLKEIYNLITTLDLDIKTGKKEDAVALDLLITKICVH